MQTTSLACGLSWLKTRTFYSFQGFFPRDSLREEAKTKGNVMVELFARLYGVIANFFPSWKQRLREKKYAEAWCRFARGPGRVNLLVLDRAIENVLPTSAGTVLHLLCGKGRFSERLAAKGCQVLGIDLNRFLIEAARKRGSEVYYDRADASEAHFVPEHFDAAVASAAHLLSDGQLERLVSNVRRGLKRSGMFVMTTDHPARLGVANEKRLPSNYKELLELGETVALDTSWDGAEEMSYLRSIEKYRAALLASFREVEVRVVDLPEEPHSYLMLIAKGPKT